MSLRSGFVRALRGLALCVGALLLLSPLPSLAKISDATAKEKIAALSVPFVANQGQWDPRAAFAAQTFAGTVFVTTEGEMVYSLRGKPSKAGELGKRSAGAVLTESLVNDKQQLLKAAPAGFRPQETKVSYFIGNDADKHRASLPSYERVNLGEMYPGINVQLRATGNNIEKIFTVAPQQNPSQIQVRVSGASELSLNDKGELIALTGEGSVAYTAPIAYQENALGERESVQVAYALAAYDASGERVNQYGFTLGAYDTSRPLVIDPLLASTYLGGSGGEFINAMAISASDGTIYVTGITSSTNFPTTGGAPQPALATADDGFVSQFNPALTVLLGSTYFGGDGNDTPRAIAVLATSAVFIAGTTTSTNLPDTATGAQPTPPSAGNTHGFVARFTASLAVLSRASYIGGNADSEAHGLVAHAGGVLVVGKTLATNLINTAGALQAAKSGSALVEDAYVSLLNTNLTAVTRTTYFGGGASSTGDAIARDVSSGDIFIVGQTLASTLPNNGGSAQPVKGGGIDAYMARLSGDLTTLRESTFFGGSLIDRFRNVAIHPLTGDVYGVGFTDSLNLPNTGSGGQSSNGGNRDGMVARFSADLTTVLGATYYGGSGAATNEVADHVAVHPLTGDVYIAGNTNSTDLTDTTNGIQPGLLGGADAFVGRLRADLGVILQATYLGGTGGDSSTAIAVHPFNGEVIVAGRAAAGFPGVASGAFDTFGGGGGDGFLTRLTPGLTLLDNTPDTFAFPPTFGAPVSTSTRSMAVRINGISNNTAVSVSGAPNPAYCISSTAFLTCDIQAFTISPTAVLDNGHFLSLRNTSSSLPDQVVTVNITVGSSSTIWELSSGSAAATHCSMDIDGDGLVQATTDGLMLARAMFGLTGTAVTNGAIGAKASRTTWPAIRNFLNTRCGQNFAL